MKRSWRILVVDDDKLSVECVIAGVDWTALEAEPLAAFSGTQAQEILSRQTIDIMVCDIEMPGGSGLKLLEWAKECHSKVECIFLTSHENFRYAQQAIKLGSFDYLLKPASYDELRQVIADAQEKIRQRDAQAKLVGIGREWVDRQVDSLKKQADTYKTQEQLVAETQKYILQHFAQELSVEQLAKRLFVSADHLTRVFKKQTGITVLEYIVNQRIAVAERMLLDTDLPTKLVAAAVGYPSYNNFFRSFKNLRGIGPSQYRDKMKQAKV